MSGYRDIFAGLTGAPGRESSPTGLSNMTSGYAEFFRPILEAVAAEAKRKSDPVQRLYDVGGAIFDSSSDGSPFSRNLAALDESRSKAVMGAGNMFLNVLGMERQLAQLQGEERRHTERMDIERERLALSRSQADKESWTVEKVGETREGAPIYARVSKSGKVEPVIPGAAPVVRTRLPHAEIEHAPGSAPGDKAANEVAAILEQSKRGPQFVGRTPGAVPTVPFELAPQTPPQDGAEVAKDGEPPYRIYKGKPVLTPAQVEVDKKFGKEYAEFTTRGGYAAAQKNLAQLSGVLDRMNRGESLTGPIFGTLPRAAARIAYPKETQALEQVEDVVQTNLRLILGAQFTQKEADRLIARAYNPALDSKYNAERLGRLVLSMQQALDAKKMASTYFEKHGTMAGYKGPPIPSIAEIDGAIERPGASGRDSWKKTPGGTRFRVVE